MKSIKKSSEELKNSHDLYISDKYIMELNNIICKLYENNIPNIILNNNLEFVERKYSDEVENLVSKIKELIDEYTEKYYSNLLIKKYINNN